MLNKPCIISVATCGYNYLFSKLIQSQKLYAKKYNYNYFCITSTPWKINPNIAAWLKIALVKKLMENGQEKIFFIDSDCLIRSSAPPIFESYNFDTYPMWIAKGKSARYNSGVFALKSCEKMKKLMSTLIKTSAYKVPKKDEAPYENGHIIYHLNKRNDIGILDHILWNNNSFYNESSFVQHFSGGALRKMYLLKICDIKSKMFFRANAFFEKIKKKSPIQDTSKIEEHLNILLIELSKKYFFLN